MNQAAPLGAARQEIELFKNRKRPAAPALFVRFTPHEDRGCAVTESKSTQLRVQPGDKSCGTSSAIEANVKVTGYHSRVMKRFIYELHGVRWHNRVRVQKPQHVSPSSARAFMHLHPTSAFRRNDFRAARTRNFARVIIATAVHDYHFDAP